MMQAAGGLACLSRGQNRTYGGQPTARL